MLLCFRRSPAFNRICNVDLGIPRALAVLLIVLNISCRILRAPFKHNEKTLETFLETYNVILIFNLIKHYASKRDDHLRTAWLLLRLVPNKTSLIFFRQLISNRCKCNDWIPKDQTWKATKLKKNVWQIESLYSNRDLDTEDEVLQMEGNLPVCSVSGKPTKNQPLCICPNSGLLAIHDEYLSCLNRDNRTGPHNSSIRPIWYYHVLRCTMKQWSTMT